MARRAVPTRPELSLATQGDSETATLDDDDAVTPDASSIDPFNSAHASRIAYQSVLGVLHSFATTLCIARSLANAERAVDLAGLHETAGLLCARALDLRPEHGRTLIPRLRSVLEELDALHTSLVPARPDGPSARA